MVGNGSVSRLSIPSVPQFTAWMTINGEETPMYGVSEQPNKTICYVESQTGQNFAIYYEDTRSRRDFGYSAGVAFSGKTQRSHATEARERPFKRAISAARFGATQERAFIFCDIPTTSDADAATMDEATFKSLGSVTLHIDRFKSRRRSLVTCPQVVPREERGLPSLHEDSKKASLTHAVSFGNDRKQIAPRTGRGHVYDWLDCRETPFHVFEFRYRTRAILELEGFVTPAPLPVSASLSPSPALPSAGPSNSNSNASSSNVNRTKKQVIVISDDEDDQPAPPRTVKTEEELSKLEEELAELQRQSRMAQMRRQLGDSSSSSSGSQSQSMRSNRVKRERIDGEDGSQEKKPRVGKENDSNSSLEQGGGKGKEVIVLDDSD